MRWLPTTVALAIGALLVLDGLALASVRAESAPTMPSAGAGAPPNAPPSTPTTTPTTAPPLTATTIASSPLPGDRRELIIFLQPVATDGQIDAIRQRLARMTDVQSIRFVDKAEAYQEMKRFFANDPELMSAITEADAPVSFHVLPQPKVNRHVVGSRLAGYAGVLNIAYPPTTGPRRALPVTQP